MNLSIYFYAYQEISQVITSNSYSNSVYHINNKKTTRKKKEGGEMVGDIICIFAKA